jgi:hypothetical protein
MTKINKKALHALRAYLTISAKAEVLFKQHRRQAGDVSLEGIAAAAALENKAVAYKASARGYLKRAARLLGVPLVKGARPWGEPQFEMEASQLASAPTGKCLLVAPDGSVWVRGAWHPWSAGWTEHCLTR